MGGGADGRRDDHGVEGEDCGNRWSPVATQDPIKKDGKMADLLLGRQKNSRRAPTGEKGGGAKRWTVGGHAVTFSQVVALQCLMRTPRPLPGGGTVGGEVIRPSPPSLRHTLTHSHFLLRAAAGTFPGRRTCIQAAHQEHEGQKNTEFT